MISVEARPAVPDIPSDLTFRMFRALAAPVAPYRQGVDPDLALSCGLIISAEEVVTTPEPLVPLGNALWHLDAVTHRIGGHLGELASLEAENTSGLNEYQDTQQLPVIPVFLQSGQDVPLENWDRNVAGVSLLRIADMLSPKSGSLWVNLNEMPPVGLVLMDALARLSSFATQCGIKLDDAARAALIEMYARPRDAQVWDSAEALVAPGRERIKMDRWVKLMLAESVADGYPIKSGVY